MNEILSLRLALEEAQALIHPEQINVPPIMEPIPAQLPEQQNEGLAMNIDELISRPICSGEHLQSSSGRKSWQ